MASMTRKEAREEAFRLLFETEFHGSETPNDVYTLSVDNREVAQAKKVHFKQSKLLDSGHSILSNY